MPAYSPAVAISLAITLLIASNVFMTFAWYGHLKYPDRALWLVILVSWGIAFFEYVLQVPANRIGFTALSASQLKVIQEAITFIVFAVFSYFYLKQAPTKYDYGAFVLIFMGVAVSLFQPRA